MHKGMKGSTPNGNKRVLIVGPDFTPSSLPPALRIRLFARHLPEFGWEPTVIATKTKFLEGSFDLENLELVPKRMQVIRTGALPVPLTRHLGFSDIGIRSFWNHWYAVWRLCRKIRVDLVFISVPPFIPAVIARLAHQCFRVPYVIDYIDPWVSTIYRDQPRKKGHWKRNLSHHVSSVLEPYVLKHVQHIIGVSKGTTDGIVARYGWLKESDATEIPYGGEASDFQYLRQNPRSNRFFSRNDGLLHVSYVGRGGADMIPALRTVFEAVRIGLRRKPQVFAGLRLHFIGTTYAANADGLYQVLPVAKECGVEKHVDEHPGRVAYLDALQILIDSHALLIVGSQEPHYTASKIFPYILAQRPIVAVFHEQSSVVPILRDTRAGVVETFGPERPLSDQSQEVYRRLANVLELPSSYTPPTRWEKFEPFTARSMTDRLSQVFNLAVANPKYAHE